MQAYITGVNGQNINVIISSDPVGYSEDNRTFDYPILSSVTLMCIATAADGSPATVTSYEWINTLCYTNPVWSESCFYRQQTVQNVTGNNILARDHGLVLCIATISGSEDRSALITLRISGMIAKHYKKYCSYV